MSSTAVNSTAVNSTAAWRNFAHQTIWTADNIDILRGMNSETVDLIYLDPPFNSNANYAAPIGSQAAGAEFKDTWGLNDIDLAWCDLIRDEHPGVWHYLTAVREIHGKSQMSYLIYMTPRLLEMWRILKSTGTIFLHCDPTAGHYLKVLLDAVFGKDNMRNEIVWSYKRSAMTSAKNVLPRKHDTIFFYSKTDDYVFHAPREDDMSDAMQKRWGKYLDEAGNVRWRDIKREPGQVRKHRERLIRELGREPRDDDVAWVARSSLLRSVWTDITPLSRGDKESVGYPTQKPLKLLQRIISMCSNDGDMVLDPFCGCATACVAAEGLRRQWVGIDIAPLAAKLVAQRLRSDMPALTFSVTNRTDIPERTDLATPPKPNSQDVKERLYDKQAGHCAGCGEYFLLRNLTVDHIVPRSRGGTDHASNLQLLCGACNSTKSDKPQEYLIARLRSLGVIDDDDVVAMSAATK